MTQISIRSTEPGVSFNSLVSSVLTGSVLLLSAVLLFSQFAA